MSVKNGQHSSTVSSHFHEAGRVSMYRIASMMVISMFLVISNAETRYVNASSAPVRNTDSSLLKAEMQDLDAVVSRSGAVIHSVSESEGYGDFSINPVLLSRNSETVSIPDGNVLRSNNEVLLDRGILAERFTTSTEGIRQDFIIKNKISGTGELLLALTIAGATAGTDKNGISLMLPQGRKLVYHSLRVTDATGKVLDARMECRSRSEVAIMVNDYNAVYPVTIDPTITDADWAIINPQEVGGNSGVYAMVYYGGSLYFGGQFTAMVKVKTPDYIAKWDGSTWSAVGTASGGNLPGRIDALAFDSSGNLYAGGYNSSNAGGFIKKWNGTAWTDLGTVNGNVKRIVYYNNNVYVAGLFTTPANRVAKWNGSSWSGLGTGLDNEVWDMAIDGSGAVYVVGSFSNAGGTAANKAAKWNGTTWSALGTGFDQQACACVLDGSGNLYATGYFLTAGGTTVNRIAKWNGTTWSALGSGLQGLSQNIGVCIGYKNSTLYVGGYFNTAGGVTSKDIAKWDGTSWSALGSTTVDACVRSIGFDGNNNVFAGGDFMTAAGKPCNGIAKWNGSSWNSLGNGMGGNYGEGVYTTIGDNAGNLYVGGPFSIYDGTTSIQYIAKWNGSSWSAVGSGISKGPVSAFALDRSGNLYAAGYDPNSYGGYVKKWNGSSWSDVGDTLDSNPNAITIDSSGNIYIGGYFTNYIAKYNGTAWVTVGSGMDNTVNSLAAKGDTIFAGGDFTQAGGVAAKRIAKWNGTSWSALGAGMNKVVNALLVKGDTLFAGGTFDTIGTTRYNRIARWNGSSWSALGGGIKSYSVNCLEKDNSGNIYAGGSFDTVETSTLAKNIAKWDGSSWSALGSGADALVYSLWYSSTANKMYAGGNFFTAGSKVSPYFASVAIASATPVISSVSVPANATYGANQNLNFTVNTSAAITVDTTSGKPQIALTIGATTRYASYVSGSGTSALVFRYTTQSGDFDNDGITVGASIVANGGTLRDAGSQSLTLTLQSVGSTASVNVDAVAPTVSSVTVPSNATYKTSDNLNFTVNFSESVTVTGTPRIALTVGSSTVYASYVSGSASTALLFRYIVQSNDLDNDGISVTSPLELNSGTIADAAGNSAVLALNSVGVTTGVLVDAVVPTVSSVTVPSNASYNTGDSLTFSVNYSEAVTVTGTPRIALTVGLSTVYATYVSGSASTALLFRYIVQSNNLDNDGISVTTPLDLNSGTINDAAGNASALALNSIGVTTGVLVDAVVPTVSSVTVPSNATYKNGDTLSFTVNYSEAVMVTGTPRIALTVGASTAYATYVSGSTSTALLFRYIVQNNDFDNDGVGVTTPLDLNSGTINDAAGNASALALNSIGVTTGVLVDAVIPTVSSVTVPSNATYKTGDTLSFTVNYSEAVTVTGTPRIALTVGSSTAYATYVSGSASTALLFRYSVQNNDFDNDGIGVTTPLDLNSGTISDATGNASALALNSIAVTTGILIDAVAPAISSVTVPSNASYKAGTSLNFTVNFNKTVTVTGTPRIALAVGSSTVYADYVSGSASSALLFRYSVQTNDLDNDGITVAGSLDLNSGTINDAAGNASALILNSVGVTTSVLVDAVAPAISSVTVPSGKTYKSGDSLNFTVNFSESVTVTGTPRIALTVGSSSVYANYVSGSASSALLFRYSVQMNDVDNDGISVAGSLDLNSGTINDAAGNASALTLNSVGVTTSVLVDAVAPVISSVTVPSGKTYKSGDTLNFTTNFGESVLVTGAPRIALTVGSSTVYANYISGSAGTALLFRYVVQNGDLDNDGIVVANTLQLNGGSIADTLGNNGLLTLNSVGTTTGILVDAVAPAINSVAVPLSGTYKAGDTLTFKVDYSESVIITGIPRIALTIGTSTVYADYMSGSASSVLLFRYVIQNGDFDNNGIDITSPLQLNGGTIKDSTGNDGTLVLNGVGATGGIHINATSSASVTKVTVPEDKIYVKGDTLRFNIQYDKRVIVSGTPQISVTIGDSVRYAVTQSSSTLKNLLEFTLVIDSSNVDSNGITFNSVIQLNGGTIIDSTGVPALLLIDNSMSTAGIIVKKAQTVNFVLGNDSIHVYGDRDIVLTGSASSALPLSFVSSDTTIARIFNDTVRLINAGIVAITAVQPGNGNYLAATSAPDTLIVSKKLLTVTAEKKSRYYGSANPEFTVVYSGYTGSDNEHSIDTVPKASCVATVSSNAGTYPITISGGVSSKYAFSYIGDTLTIQRAVLAVKANDVRRFAGQANPVFTLTCNGFANNESISMLQAIPVISCGATASSPAGTYPITVSGGTDENYTFSYTAGTLTIDSVAIKSPATITLTTDSLSKVNAFTINAAGINWDSVTVRAVSSDTTLVKDSSIILGGKDSSRTIQVFPTIDKSGVDTITIIVSTSAGELVRTAMIVIIPVTVPSMIAGNITMQTESDGTIDVEPVIFWQKITNATDYKLEIATDSAFTQIKVSNIYRDTVSSGILLDPATKYYFAVSAGNSAGFGARSEVVTGTTAGIPVFSVLHGPVDGDRVEPTVKMVWYSSVNLKRIDLQLSKDANFGSPIIDTILPGTDRTLFTPRLERNITFYWRIRPYGSGGQGAWSNGWFVTRDTTAVGTTLVGIVTDTSAITIGTSDEVGAKILIKGTGDSGTVVRMDVTPVKNAQGLAPVTQNIVMQSSDTASAVMTIVADDSLLPAGTVKSNIRVYTLDSTGAYKILWDVVPDANGQIMLSTIPKGSFFVGVDTAAPKINDSTALTPQVGGAPATIKGIVSDEIANMKVAVYYRRGGSTAVDSTLVNVNSDGSFNFAAADSPLDNYGFEYWLAGTDGVNQVVLPKNDIPVKITGVSASDSIRNLEWRLFSIPSALTHDSITATISNLGMYGRYADWLLYSRTATGIKEYGTDLYSLTPGSAYWLKTWKKAVKVGIAEGTTTPVNKCFTISIPAKTWISLGNPYLFKVSWASILDSSHVTSSELVGPYRYRDSSWIAPLLTPTIDPFEGYFVYNSTNSDQIIRIPSIAAKSSLSKKNIDSTRTITLSWQVKGPTGRDHGMLFGFSNMADSTKVESTLNLRKPESPETGLVQSWFERARYGQMPLMTDFVSSKDSAGATWSLVVSGITTGSVYTGSVGNLETLPKNWQAIIIDRKAHVVCNLSDSGYTFVGAENETERNLELAVGTAEFVNGLSRGIVSLPQSLTLNLVKRNKMPGTFALRFAIPQNQTLAAQRVVIDIVNLQGKLVKKLIDGTYNPGYYMVNWTPSQSATAAGCYLIVLRMDKQIRNIPITLVQ